MNFDALAARLKGQKHNRKMPSPDKKTNDALKERHKRLGKLKHRLA